MQPHLSFEDSPLDNKNKLLIDESLPVSNGVSCDVDDHPEPSAIRNNAAYYASFITNVVSNNYWKEYLCFNRASDFIDNNYYQLPKGRLVLLLPEGCVPIRSLCIKFV